MDDQVAFRLQRVQDAVKGMGEAVQQVILTSYSLDAFAEGFVMVDLRVDKGGEHDQIDRRN